MKSASRSPDATSASAMIPIVFCASFVPWVRATKPPETSWPRRKTRLTFAGERRATSQTIDGHQRERDGEPGERRDQRRLQHLRPEPVPLDDVPPLRPSRPIP